MGAGDVYLGDIGGCRFYMGKAQYETWKHTQLIIDVIDGHGGGTFSLEGPEGKAFTPARGCSAPKNWWPWASSRLCLDLWGLRRNSPPALIQQA